MPYAMPGSEALGSKIAEAFAKKFNVVLLENHGTVIGAEDLFVAFQRFETLEYTARVQIKAKTLGPVRTISKNQQYHYNQQNKGKNRDNHLLEFCTGLPSNRENKLREDICRYVLRSYQKKLFISTEGTFSARLADGCFLITPFGLDRHYTSPEDLVLIKHGEREQGKWPSRSVLLHQAIYANQTDIQAIVIAHPPNLMAFNITENPLDSKIIPEAYILLREIQRLPFLAPMHKRERVAKMLRKNQPVAMKNMLVYKRQMITSECTGAICGLARSF